MSQDCGSQTGVAVTWYVVSVTNDSVICKSPGNRNCQASHMWFIVLAVFPEDFPSGLRILGNFEQHPMHSKFNFVKTNSLLVWDVTHGEDSFSKPF